MPWHTFVRYKNLLAFFFFFFMEIRLFVLIIERDQLWIARKRKEKKSIENLLLLFAHCAHTGEFHLCAWNSIHESNIAARFMNMFTTLFIFFFFFFSSLFFSDNCSIVCIFWWFIYMIQIVRFVLQICMIYNWYTSIIHVNC